MKRVQYILIAILFFCFGFYVSKRLYKKDRIHYMKVNIHKNGLTWGLIQNENYNSIAFDAFFHNKQLKEGILKGGDSAFLFFMNSSPLLGNNEGIFKSLKMDSSYYECVIYEKTPKQQYKLDNLYLLTPDTVYHLIPEPVIFKLDTVKPLKKGL